MHQPHRAARTCWLGRPGSRTIWRPGDENPTPGTFHRPPSKTPPHQSKDPSEVQNPAPSARPPREQSAAPPHQKRKTIRHNLTPHFPGPPQDPVTENKDKKLNTKINNRTQKKQQNQILKEIQTNQKGKERNIKCKP
ncbi:hypothetical protein TNCV_4129611 [Trichonephila clavipes]|nr:hypothetical protein TNCV_4129611 [Trichonephila clavipes]